MAIAERVRASLRTRCVACEALLSRVALERRLFVCPECGYHFRLSADQRLRSLLDAGSFDEIDAGIGSRDPLGFPDQPPYAQRLAEMAARTGHREAVRTGTGRIGRIRVAIGVFDFHFMGGSMGSAVGEKLARLMEHALSARLPLVVVSASGGARMQEGIFSLMQMAKLAAALGRLRSGGIPFVSVLADPTTGGVAASIGLLGDVNLAEPRALIGFAGPRVITQALGEILPAGFQRSEFLLAHGMVDAVVPRGELRPTLVRLLRLLVPRGVVASRRARPRGVKRRARSRRHVEE